MLDTKDFKAPKSRVWSSCSKVSCVFEKIIQFVRRPNRGLLSKYFKHANARDGPWSVRASHDGHDSWVPSWSRTLISSYLKLPWIRERGVHTSAAREELSHCYDRDRTRIRENTKIKIASLPAMSETAQQTGYFPIVSWLARQKQKASHKVIKISNSVPFLIFPAIIIH